MDKGEVSERLSQSVDQSFGRLRSAAGAPQEVRLERK